MSWLSDLLDAIGRIFGGGDSKPPIPVPTGATVKIRVRDAGGGNVSIGGALVTIGVRGQKVTRGTTLDTEGRAIFHDVEPGPRHLWVEKRGYRDHDEHFEVKAPLTDHTVAITPGSTLTGPGPGPGPGPRPPMTSDKVTALRRVAEAYRDEYAAAHGAHGSPGAKYEAFVRRAAACLHYGAPTLGIRADPDVKLNGKRRTDTLSQDVLWTPDGIYDFILAAGQHGTDLNKIVWNKVDEASNGKPIQPDRNLVPKGSGGRDKPEGSVKAQRHAFADRDGPFVAVGASLFCAPWLLKHDPDKLDANLDWLADRKVDFVRYILELSGQYWRDREQNPLESGFDQRLADLIDRVYSFGLRSQVTIFGEWEHSNTQAKRHAVVNMVARVINGREPKVMYVEIENEGGKPGRHNDMAEIRNLAALFKSREPNILVALTSPTDRDHARELYEGGGADVFTFHDQRSAVNEGLKHGDVAGIPGIPALRSSGEPRGPGASASGDVSDPATLASDFRKTINAKIGAYCYHSRAGVGMGSRHWPEPNLWSHPTADAAVRAIIRSRDEFSVDQANR